jgi:hypothetical protein
MNPARLWLALAALAGLLSTGKPAFARSGGVAALGCDACHRGGRAPTVTLSSQPADLAVGQPVTLTIGVSQTNGSLAGFYLTTANQAPGTFEAIETGTVATATDVMHTTARAGTGGTTTFKVQWTPSQATGVEFDVYAVSANGDRTNQGDGPGTAKLELLVGCTGATYYIDQDGDGYGSSDPAYPPRKDCAQPAGYAALTGDCDDFRARAHPNALELCDLEDNDCDGNIDEDVVEQPYCEDRDGDGHGVASGMTKMDCKPSSGFGDCAGDCDDHDASVHPGAVEACDGRDDDCNGKVDEGVRQVCGMGLCARYAAGCSSTCKPGEPFEETCNGYDDDCDGTVDNGNSAALCGSANARCVQGHCTADSADGSGGGGSVGPQQGGAAGGLGLAAAKAPATCSLRVPGSVPGSGLTGVAFVIATLTLVRRRLPSRTKIRQAGAFGAIDSRFAPHCRGVKQVHRKRPAGILPLTLALTLLGCGNASRGAASEPAAGGAGGGSPGGYASGNAAELFDAQTLPTFELSLPPERWQYLQAHAVDEQYEPAELRFRGELVGQVGLRFKGSIGTLTNCFDAEGNPTCRKLSMKLKFDEYAPEQRFYGLKRVNLHAMMRDASLLHEKLTYDLYRELGVAAPRSTWAIAQVNGVSLGLFSLVEEVDGRFTKDRWPEQGNGNLYKEVWPRSTLPEDYAAALETNEETATHEAFAAFAGELQAAPDAAARREVLSRWLDLELLARYMAVDDAIANIDGATAIYCSASEPTACGNHNYFFYLSEDQARFQLVPWDLDATLWPQTSYDNVPPWQVTPEDCSVRYRVGFDGASLAAPGCDPLFSGLAADLSDYDVALQSLLEGPFSLATAEAAIDEHAAFIADAVAVEPGGQSLERWHSEVAMLKHNLPLLHARARARRNGLTPAALDLSLGAVNDFEALDASLLALLPSFSNPSTTTSISLAGDPLEGQKSLRLAFEYRNQDQTPWAQWTNVALGFQNRPVDLSKYSGIRMTLRTDSPRTVRVDLDSLLYEASIEGIKFGWEVAASNTPLTVELPLAAASLPVWAHATGDQLPAIRARVEALAFHPMCNNREALGGLLAEGTSDAGFLELDAIELF